MSFGSFSVCFFYTLFNIDSLIILRCYSRQNICCIFYVFGWHKHDKNRTVFRFAKKEKKTISGCIFNTVSSSFHVCSFNREHQKCRRASKRKQLYHFYLWSFQHKSNIKGTAKQRLAFFFGRMYFVFHQFIVAIPVVSLFSSSYMKYFCRLNYDG